MSFPVPSLDELRALLLAFWKAKFPGANTGSRFAYHWKRLTAVAGAVTDLHAHILGAQDDVMPDRSEGSWLERWGAIVGVAKKGATPARRAQALRVAGATGSIPLVGDELEHIPTGLRFQITNALVIPAAPLYVDLDIEGIDTGSQTRLKSGEQLSFVAAAPGINSLARLILDLNEDGFDVEQDGPYRVRVTDEFSQPREGGSQSDFVKWALEVPGITSAYCYPNRAGVGTVDVVGLHTGQGTARTLITTENATLLAYLVSKAPSQISGTGGSLRVLTAVVDPEDVEILITPDGTPENNFDWNDAAPPVVAAWNPATLALQFGADRPGTMLAGHRICLKGVASAQDGAPLTIEALTGADTVILRTAPNVAPVATDIVYAGGSLTEPIRDAVIAHLNGEDVLADTTGPIPASRAGSTVGLRILAKGVGPANPGGLYGPWLGGINRATLFGIAVYSPGARNVVIAKPVADYEATDYPFPNDLQIGLVAPRAVLIRKG